MYNLGYLILCMAWQDCYLILPPYPFSLEDPDNMSIDESMTTRGLLGPSYSSHAGCALLMTGL